MRPGSSGASSPHTIKAKRPRSQRAHKTSEDRPKSWGTRWLEAVSKLPGATPARMERGLMYACERRVEDVHAAEGKVKARVRGSRPKPYDVSLQMAPLDDATWEKAIEAIAQQPDLTSALLSGEVPERIEHVFQCLGVSLFPVRETDLLTRCTCPDWSVMCKHVAALSCVLGEAINREPFLLFALRGRSKKQVLAALRRGQAGGSRRRAGRRRAQLSAGPSRAQLGAKRTRARLDAEGEERGRAAEERDDGGPGEGGRSGGERGGGEGDSGEGDSGEGDDGERDDGERDSGERDGGERDGGERGEGTAAEVRAVSLQDAVPEDYERPRGDLRGVRFRLNAPREHGEILELLGQPPSWSRVEPIASWLRPTYAAASAKARKLALSDPSGDVEAPAVRERAAKAPKPVRKRRKKP